MEGKFAKRRELNQNTKDANFMRYGDIRHKWFIRKDWEKDTRRRFLRHVMRMRCSFY